MECTASPVPFADRPAHFAAVPLRQATRLINHGPTVLVSAAHEGVPNVMAAAWSMPVDYDPPKVSVVIDKSAFTRRLIEASGSFALNVPGRALADLTVGVGTDSAHDLPTKLARHGVLTFAAEAISAPLILGCVAWLECRVLPEPHIQQAHDLFIGEVVAAWADPRVFRDGRWHFDEAPDELRTLHYVAGGQFHATGASVRATAARGESDAG